MKIKQFFLLYCKRFLIFGLNSPKFPSHALCHPQNRLRTTYQQSSTFFHTLEFSQIKTLLHRPNHQRTPTCLFHVSCPHTSPRSTYLR